MSEMYYFVQDILESTFQGFVHVLNLRKGLDMHGRLLFLLLFLFIVFELFFSIHLPLRLCFENYFIKPISNIFTERLTNYRNNRS